MKKRKVAAKAIKALAVEMDANVGIRIRKRRLELGLTQQELAAKLGLSYQQVQKYETGANRISAGRLWAIAKVLAAEPAYFFQPAGRDKGRIRTGRASKPPVIPTSHLDPAVRRALANLVAALSRNLH